VAVLLPLVVPLLTPVVRRLASVTQRLLTRRSLTPLARWLLAGPLLILVVALLTP